MAIPSWTNSAARSPARMRISSALIAKMPPESESGKTESEPRYAAERDHDRGVDLEAAQSERDRHRDGDLALAVERVAERDHRRRHQTEHRRSQPTQRRAHRPPRADAVEPGAGEGHQRERRAEDTCRRDHRAQPTVPQIADESG